MGATFLAPNMAEEGLSQMETAQANTSGGGRLAAVPPEVDRWNWGAFLLSWIWGIGNGALIALLALIPVFGIIMMFILGARGSIWAWRYHHWESIEHFKRVQRRWTWAGVVVWVIAIALSVMAALSVTRGLRNSDPYRMGVVALEHTPQAAVLLGSPMRTGSPMGRLSLSNGSGSSTLSFPVEGSRRSGTVIVHATRSQGHWGLDSAVLELDGGGERIALSP